MPRELNPLQCMANAAGLSYPTVQQALTSRPVTFQVAAKIQKVCPAIPIEAFVIVGDRRAANGLKGIRKQERLGNEKVEIRAKIKLRLSGTSE